jgi:hypothetical protein
VLLSFPERKDNRASTAKFHDFLSVLFLERLLGAPRPRRPIFGLNLKETAPTRAGTHLCLIGRSTEPCATRRATDLRNSLCRESSYEQSRE